MIRGTNVDLSKLNFNISMQERINHTVAHCGDAKIMKYIPGINTGKASADLIDNLTSTNIKEFFLDINCANKHKMRLDWAGDNCIINPVNGKLTTYDYSPGGKNIAWLSMFMSFTNMSGVLNTTQQNNLLKKGLISLLELIKDRKIKVNKRHLSRALSCDAFGISFKDQAFLKNVEKILNQYKKSEIDINSCLKKIQEL